MIASGEVNFPINSKSLPSVTVTIGPNLVASPYLLPVEIHGIITYTEVKTIKELIKEVQVKWELIKEE